MSFPTKIYFDTEFTGLHKNTTLISLALVSQNNQAFYIELTDYDRNQITSWLEENVLAKLGIDKINKDFIKSFSQFQYMKGSKSEILPKLKLWLDQFEKIEIWSDCLSYDWVLFNDLFGTALDIPKNISYIPLDICTKFHDNGIDPDITREEFVSELLNKTKHDAKHTALWDAYIIKLCNEKLDLIKGLDSDYIYKYKGF